MRAGGGFAHAGLSQGVSLTPKPDALLPDYELPPVLEVVCGVLFKPIKLLVPHFGLLWEEFQSEYPTFQEAVPLGIRRS